MSEQPIAILNRERRARELFPVLEQRMAHFVSLPGCSPIQHTELLLDRQEDPAWPGMYVIGGPPGVVKIGVSKNVHRRCAIMQTSSPDDLVVLAVCGAFIELEQAIHERFASYRVRGEWFRLTARVAAFTTGLQMLELGELVKDSAV